MAQSARVLRLVTVGFIVSASPFAAMADVVISSDATQNMSCSGGVCQPTASDAVLNVSDLESLLASGNVEVTTTGSGVQANSIDVKASLAWSTQSSLALDASTAITIDQEVSATGNGGLSLAAAGGIEGLTFGAKGRVAFQTLSNPITINGTAFTLVNSIASLANAIASNPSGAFALADDYDASQDGTYSAPPIPTFFTGKFDGLGNTISHFSIDDQSAITGTSIAMFTGIEDQGIIAHLRLARAKTIGGNKAAGQETIGTLVGGIGSGSSLFQDSATGTVLLVDQTKYDDVGGLVGLNSGLVEECFARVSVRAGHAKGVAAVGGLVGANGATVTESFSTGAVTGEALNFTGGLTGYSDGVIEDSYATGAVTSGARAKVGGLVGEASLDEIEFSYSTGAVSGGASSVVGGFAGVNKKGIQSDNYWDTTTSGTTRGVGKGVGKNISGLTSQQLESGLPIGFDPSIWGEKKNINNGLPYLLANPPPK